MGHGAQTPLLQMPQDVNPSCASMRRSMLAAYLDMQLAGWSLYHRTGVLDASHASLQHSLQFSRTMSELGAMLHLRMWGCRCMIIIFIVVKRRT